MFLRQHEDYPFWLADVWEHEELWVQGEISAPSDVGGEVRRFLARFP